MMTMMRLDGIDHARTNYLTPCRLSEPSARDPAADCEHVMRALQPHSQKIEDKEHWARASKSAEDKNLKTLQENAGKTKPDKKLAKEFVAPLNRPLNLGKKGG